MDYYIVGYLNMNLCIECGLVTSKKFVKKRTMCVKCYSKWQYRKERGGTLVYKKDHEKVETCNHNVSFKVRGFCKRCYTVYWRQNASKICDCGRETKLSLNPICAVCKKVKYKWTHKQINLTPEIVKEMKLLVIKEKWNLLNPIDNFRLIDVYLRGGFRESELLYQSGIEDTIQFIIQTFQSHLEDVSPSVAQAPRTITISTCTW